MLSGFNEGVTDYLANIRVHFLRSHHSTVGKVSKMEEKSSAMSNIAPVAPTRITRYDKDDKHKPVIVCALAALPIPSQPPKASQERKRQRRTFWTKCATCKEKNKFPITNLACQVVCPACTETFTAIEVARPRNTSLYCKEKLESSSSVAANSSLQSTAVTPIADVAYHPPNIQGKRKDGEVKISEAFPKPAVEKLLQARMKEILEKKLNDRQAKDEGQ
ncbi:hypothetical protein OsI_19583 [Oryza sativa Indica Group]|uniref:Uncharacterized protein n=2 Tax=Oryza TaxID=4527 RepID=B8AX22_ORYSI|nr:hypothetical protein OsI_19583 [Oryza sativa Indica Group]